MPSTRRGSFAAAAQALLRVPSALTHAGEEAGRGPGRASCSYRQGRRALLTPAGRMLLDEGRHLLRAAGDLECRVQARGHRLGERTAHRGGCDHRLRRAAAAAGKTSTARPSGTRLRLSYEVLGGCWDALPTGRADLAVGAPGDAAVRRRLPARGRSATCRIRVRRGARATRWPSAPEPIAPRRHPAASRDRRRPTPRAQLPRAQQRPALGPGRAHGARTWRPRSRAQVAGLGVGYLPVAARPRRSRGRTPGAARGGGTEAGRCPCISHGATNTRGKALDWLVERLQDETLRRALLGLPPPSPPARAAGVKLRRG
ncbi:MAG: hypothetical protein MZW92_60640 [Comamonadaceae bacterium]|nr:hypothetical protein [Comamonadaceae bacterium]